MKSYEEIYLDIKKRFEEKTGHSITENTVMDFYTSAISDVYEQVYQEIEGMKNPHLYTGLSGQSLDDLGFFMNIPREINEDDSQYLYRLMDWRYSAEASNNRAINNELLNLEHASYAKYIPQAYGSGTAIIYIIPYSYEEEDIHKAIAECSVKVEAVASPSVFKEYVVPEPIPVIIHAALKADGDKERIKSVLTEKIRAYSNNIAPEGDLLVGEINKLGANEEKVEYFSVLQIFVDKEEQDNVSVYQPIEKKYLLDEIIWTEA